MPPTKNPRKLSEREHLLRAIAAPLGFFVLALLICEATLAVVLVSSKLDAEHVWCGFLWMIATFIGVILIVTGLTVWKPKNLLYGKEEHANPTMEPSALRDQIRDQIVETVKEDSLKLPPAASKIIP